MPERGVGLSFKPSVKTHGSNLKSAAKFAGLGRQRIRAHQSILSIFRDLTSDFSPKPYRGEIFDNKTVCESGLEGQPRRSRSCNF
jgi:hypothetical protein